MADADLELLRRFRAADAIPPHGLLERLQEDLWQAVLEEEQRLRAPRRRRWFGGLMRPAIATAAAGAVAVVMAVGSDGGPAERVLTPTDASVQAGVLDGAATTLFGASIAAPPDAPFTGGIEVRGSDAHAARLLAGSPADAPGDEVVRLTRDPDELRELLRAAAIELNGSDPGDRIAFHLGLRWVTDPRAGSDLRAAMLRSLDGLRGIDPFVTGSDVLGRQGVVIGHLDEHSGLRSQYVLAPDGGVLLERRSFTTVYVEPACPPGTFTDHALFDRGEQVLPSQLPWVAWPQVVAACAPAA